MEKSSILHYLNGQYTYALGNHRYLFRIVTKKDDCEEVYFVYQDKYRPKGTKRVLMERVVSSDIEDFYECEVALWEEAIVYYFVLKNALETVCFGNKEFYDKEIESLNHMFIAVPHTLDSDYFDTPSWGEEAIYYQIMPERFAPTKEYSKNWFDKPRGYNMRTNGTLDGITQKLDYLSDLGIDVIYLNPIFLSNTYHRYDTIDYLKVDPSLGGEESLKRLVEGCHKRGIRIILDVVFNHTSTDFFAFQDLLKNQEKSIYKDWYFIQKFPVTISRGKYDSFAYLPFMPKLNPMNKDCYQYLMKVTKYYLEAFDVDGYRLDVCDEVSHRFWHDFREVVRSIKKDALILGEVWYASSRYLAGDECDSLMNYDSYTHVLGVVKREISPIQFQNYLGRERGEANRLSYPLSLRLISSHDTKRLYFEVSGNEKRFRLAMALNILLPGASMLYYGDEVMMDGGKDPDCRRGMVFDANKEILSFIKKLTRIKKEKAFQTAKMQVLYTNQDLFVFERKADKRYVVVFNFGNQRYSNEEYPRMDYLKGQACDFFEAESVSILYEE